VTTIRKATAAANDLLTTMDQRLKNINLAILDMPAPAQAFTKRAYDLQQQLVNLRIQLYGDQSAARREFETLPSINDRVSGMEYAIWNSTAPVPKMYNESYDIAAKQFTALLAQMRTVHASIETLEKELEINKAPYTPGRWPEWKEN
jgi:hypothetical protein